MTSPESPSAPAGQEDKLLQGRYRIARCLGSGGMGDVYLAEDLRLRRLVAVKSLKHEFCTMTEVRKRIERECVMHAQLGAHPNIITLYDRLDEDGQIHLIIEYVDGTTLKDLIDKARLGSVYLTWRESVSIACQLLEALARIHAQGIVHRDVKPANVMLTQSDTGAYTAKLMDFGIARLVNPVDGATMLTREGGSGPGTPIYMSPEQIAGTQFGPLSPASDVYAMGVVLYQMLAKHPPFQGTITDIFHGHLNAPPPPIDTGLDSTYPPQLTEIVEKALAKHPSGRYATAVDFRHALKRVTKAHGVITTLSVANTMPVASGATIPITPAVVEPASTSGWLNRRDAGAKSAGRTVIAIACVVVAVGAVVLGNFFYFRSWARPDAPADAPQQAATGTVPPMPTAPESPAPVDAVNASAQEVNMPAPMPAAVPSAPDQPMPVSLDTPPKPVAEKPVEPAPKPVAEASKPVAEAPKPKPKEVTPDAAPRAEPVETTPKLAVTPLPMAPKEEPRRTPVPQQTPVPPDVSAPSQGSAPFSEKARDQFSTAPGDANIFQDVQVNKRPAVKVN